MSEKNTKQDKNNLMEKIVSLCKRRGFVFQGSEIYGGLAGFYDYGHYGLAFANNIKNSWWKKFVDSRRDMYGINSSIIFNPKVWEASGHVTGFLGTTTDGKKFNEMFKTQVGVGEDALVAYLRPETAQGMFVNFKNTVDAFHPKLPFGMAQIGKAFRNEITPRDFIFRQREFEQMEIEYFVRPDEWNESFDMWLTQMHEWIEEVGIDTSKTTDLLVSDEDRAFYSQKTIDIEFEYPFGKKELFGLAYRTDYDLNTHKLEYVDEENATKMVPHVIEPSFGLDRAFLAILISAYDESDPERPFLKFKPNIAPVICAVSPLLKNKPELVSYAKDNVYAMLKSEFGRVMWDDNGNIGKRYRRQ